MFIWFNGEVLNDEGFKIHHTKGLLIIIAIFTILSGFALFIYFAIYEKCRRNHGNQTQEINLAAHIQRDLDPVPPTEPSGLNEGITDDQFEFSITPLQDITIIQS